MKAILLLACMGLARAQDPALMEALQKRTDAFAVAVSKGDVTATAGFLCV